MAPETRPRSEALPFAPHSTKSQDKARRRGGHEGVDHRERRGAVRLEVRARIEAEPADPEQRRADHRHGERVWGDQVAAIADPLADEERADEAGDARIDVHHRPAGEVEGAPLEDETGIRERLVETRLRRRSWRPGRPRSATPLAALPITSGPAQYQTMWAIGK